MGRKNGRKDMKPYKRLSEARGAVVRFLKANPFSTTEEIYKATGVSIYRVLKKGMFKNRRYGVLIQWRVVANSERFI